MRDWPAKSVRVPIRFMLSRVSLSAFRVPGLVGSFMFFLASKSSSASFLSVQQCSKKYVNQSKAFTIGVCDGLDANCSRRASLYHVLRSTGSRAFGPRCNPAGHSLYLKKVLNQFTVNTLYFC